MRRITQPPEAGPRRLRRGRRLGERAGWPTKVSATCTHLRDVSVSSIHVSRNGEHRTNPALLTEMLEMIRPSYVDAAPLLDREVARCETLYRWYDHDGLLTAFFLVAWESLTIDSNERPAVYMGLSATRQDTKNSGVVRQLYAEFVRDGVQWEISNQRRLVLWFTTATPSACLAAYVLFVEAEPRVDGTFTDIGAGVARAVRTRLSWPERLGDHPFVLRSVAGATRYSSVEAERVRAICARHDFDLLAKLDVQEMHGDRLLYICYLPNNTAISPGYLGLTR